MKRCAVICVVLFWAVIVQAQTTSITIDQIRALSNLTLVPTGDLVTNPAGNDILPDLNYDINIGMLSKKYLTLHAAELWVETLVAQETLATIGGRILVGPTTTLMEDEIAEEGVTLFKLKHNNFVITSGVGDMGYLEANGKVEFVSVYTLPVEFVDLPNDYFAFDLGGDACYLFTAGRTFAITGSTGNDGVYTVESCTYGAPYTRVFITGEIPADSADGYLWYISDGAGYFIFFNRDVDNSGPNAWYAGDAIFNTGYTGNGFIDLYSVRGIKAASEAGPTIVGNVRLSGTYNDWEPRWAVGNLNGLYGYATTTYGVALGVPSAAWIKIDPTNGVRIGHNVTTKIQLEADGDATFSGQITAASGAIGGWTIGASALTDTAGVVGMSSAVTGGDDIRFWAGDATPASAEFRVTEAGALTATSGAIGGWTLASDRLYAGATTTYVALSTGTYALWAGNETAASAPFRVTNAGNLNATDADITGDITGSNISTSTITAGGGAVTIDASGVTLTAGTDSVNQVKWSDGSNIYANSDVMNLSADNSIGLVVTGRTYRADGTAFYAGGGDLGTSTYRFRDLYLSGDIDWDPADTTADVNPLVNNAGTISEKTNGESKTCDVAANFTVESGIVTSCTSVSADTPTLAARIARLEAEIAELRALLAKER